ncbi:MAG: hypothetical protein R2851_12250 [Caldilineaceae bacterium]
MSINEPESTENRLPSYGERVGAIDVHQIQIRRRMSPAERLDIAFQAYQFALDAVRLTEANARTGYPPSNWRGV